MTVRTVVLRRELNRARAEAKRLEELMAGAAPCAAPQAVAAAAAVARAAAATRGGSRRLEELEALREEAAGRRERERVANYCADASRSTPPRTPRSRCAEAAEKLAAEKAEAAENLQAQLEGPQLAEGGTPLGAAPTCAAAAAGARGVARRLYEK